MRSTRYSLPVAAVLMLGAAAGCRESTAPADGARTQSGSAPTSSVTLPADTPLISTSSLPAATAGTAYGPVTLLSTGGTAPIYWYLASGSLPAEITLSINGVLSGTPTSAGSFAPNFQVQDVLGNASTRTLGLMVTGIAPTLLTTQVNAARGATTTFPLQATGGAPPYVWSFPPRTATQPAPPTWATLTAAGVLTVLPPTAGTFAIAVRLRDHAGTTVTRTVSVVVAARVAVTSAGPPNGTVGAAYRHAFTAAGAPTPFTWQRAAGTLPPGLTLTTAGVLSGSPRTAGLYTFSIKVTAKDRTTDTRPYVVAVSLAPVIPFTSLTAAHANQLYSFTLTGQRGQAPYTWTLVQGPAGLRIIQTSASARLAGTVTTAGSYPVTLRLTDASGAVVQKSFTLAVN